MAVQRTRRENDTMPINACGACGKRIKFRDDKIGQQVACPHCGETLELVGPETRESPAQPPRFEPEPETEPETEQNAESEPAGSLSWVEFLNAHWRWPAVLILVIWASAGHSEPPGLLQWTGNLATFLAAFLIAAAIGKRKLPARFENHTRWGSAVLAIGVTVWCYKTATYKEHEGNVELKSGQRVDVTTTYRRPRIPIRRFMIHADDVKPGDLRMASGPLTETGQRHGLWSIWIDGQLTFDRDQWYFHGEACTEAQFHRWSNGRE